MRGPRSLRARLTLWYTAALGGLLLALGAVAFVLLDHGLRRTADVSLESLARTVAESSRAPAPDGDFARALSSLLGPAAAERFFELLDPRGRRDPRLGPSGRPPLPLDAQTLHDTERGISSFRTVRLPGSAAPIRVLTMPVMEAGRPVQLVQAAMSLEVVDAARRRFLLVLAGLLPLALLGAAAGGWWLAGRALAPVDAMVESTRRIGAEDLSRRLTADTTDDELGRLAAVLNDMLGRLERSFTAAQQFSADAAHELRTPLTILRGELDVALAAAPAGASHRSALESCLEEVDRLSSLVEDLLFLARADAGADPPPAETVDLAAVVGDAAPALEALAARADVRLDIAAAPAPARGSGPLLFRVVFNLVENAIKHGGAGARVWIGTGTDRDQAILEVCDDGPGIPPASRDHIFDRFHRGDPARERGGAGLGLAITKAIVDLHRGAITVVAGPRTCFRVTLPHHA